MWLVACFLTSIFFSGPGSDDIQRAARKVFSDGDYQSELKLRDPADGRSLIPPGAGENGVDEAVIERSDRPRRPSADRSGRRRPVDRPQPRQRDSSPSSSMDLSGVFEVLAWTVLAVVVVLLVVWLVNALAGYNKNVVAKKEKKDPAVPSTETTAAALVRPKSEAELLADEGKFGEAIHVLLLLTIAELARRKKDLHPALTSREIVVKVPVPGPARPHLSSLVDAVEHSLFGGLEPGRPEFDACLAHFNEFADTYATGVA